MKRATQLLRRALRKLAAHAGALLVANRFLLGRTLSDKPATARRILVIRIDERVGNVLLTTPLLRALAAAYPSARIDALIAASKQALVGDLANAIPFERRNFFRRPLRFTRALFALRNTRYDVAIDASHWHNFSATSALLLAWTAAPIRIAHARGEAHRYATHLIEPRADLSEVEAKLRLLEPLDIAIAATDARLFTALGDRGEAKERMRSWLATSTPPASPIVALAPGARKTDHRIPADLFTALAAGAAKLGARPIILWGPGEKDLAEEIARASGAQLAPPTDLEELAALLRLSAAVIANDTGPMHLAVACGAPTIALFTHGDHHRWGHAYPPHAVIPAENRPQRELIESATDALRKILGIPRSPI